MERNKNVPTVIVTSGGTREDIDEVRFLTNISTGKLGAKIAEKVAGLGWNLIYIHTETAELPLINLCRDCKDVIPNLVGVKVRSTMDAYAAIKEWTQYSDIIIHSMACGDFGFKPEATKLKSNDPMAFIDSLRDRIIVNPKIVNQIKKWNPNIYLVSFKFESGQSYKNLVEIARNSMSKANGDLVVANDKKEMVAQGAHIAYLIPSDVNEPISAINGKDLIANAIMSYVGKKVFQKSLT
jgi:phosphopantothenoylcysteine synthetase/decarboxylase